MRVTPIERTKINSFRHEKDMGECLEASRRASFQRGMGLFCGVEGRRDGLGPPVSLGEIYDKEEVAQTGRAGSGGLVKIEG